MSLGAPAAGRHPGVWGIVVKRNCWEIMACGLGPRTNAEEASRRVCPAAIPGAFNGVNHGQVSGRFCWAVADTLCRGKTQVRMQEKLKLCISCPVMQEVCADEGRDFRLGRPWKQSIDEYA